MTTPSGNHRFLPLASALAYVLAMLDVGIFPRGEYPSCPATRRHHKLAPIVSQGDKNSGKKKVS